MAMSPEGHAAEMERQEGSHATEANANPDEGDDGTLIASDEFVTVEIPQEDAGADADVAAANHAAVVLAGDTADSTTSVSDHDSRLNASRSSLNSHDVEAEAVPTSSRRGAEAEAAPTTSSASEHHGTNGGGEQGTEGAMSTPTDAPPSVESNELARLKTMGFSDDTENRRALAETGNDVSLAVSMIVRERMEASYVNDHVQGFEDISVDGLPPVTDPEPSSSAAAVQVAMSEQQIQMLAMGFEEEENRRALDQTDNNVDLAVSVLVKEREARDLP